ncbi:hypothetical protein CBL_04540 [Carabus blaptoides fortunei]
MNLGAASTVNNRNDILISEKPGDAYMHVCWNNYVYVPLYNECSCSCEDSDCNAGNIKARMRTSLTLAAAVDIIIYPTPTSLTKVVPDVCACSSSLKMATNKGVSSADGRLDDVYERTISDIACKVLIDATQTNNSGHSTLDLSIKKVSTPYKSRQVTWHMLQWSFYVF